MPKKINPYLITKEQPKREYINGIILVKEGIYKIGQWIIDGVFYAGNSKKK